MSSAARPFLIVNPASANGNTGRHFDRIARAVAHAMGDFRCAFTRRRGEASDLAREAVRDGERLVVAVGGDGTASEVTDGLLEDGRLRAPELVFGCIPRGTGGDLRRTLGWPEDPGEAARTVAAGTLVVCDLGIVEFVGHDGRTQRRHFANVSSCGVSGGADDHFADLANCHSAIVVIDEPDVDTGPDLAARAAHLRVRLGHDRRRDLDHV